MRQRFRDNPKPKSSYGTCSRCPTEISKETASICRSRWTGLSTICRECDKRRHRDYVTRVGQPKTRERQRANRLKANFNLTVEEYQHMMEHQSGLCAICRKVDSTGNALAVDHDHSTGKVRGLLCWKCNTSLGGFKDDIVLLKSAINYLRRSKK